MSYREFTPSPRLAPLVECFWTQQADHAFFKLVMPDGCIDVLIRLSADSRDVEVIGAMTRAQWHRAAAGTTYLGVRFKPGMAREVLPLGGANLTDRTLPLGCLWRQRADRMVQAIAAADSVEERLHLLERSFAGTNEITGVQQAIDLMVTRQGQVDIEELSDTSGLGERQFRRSCLARTGLAPRRLARILRFRRASQLLLENRLLPLVDVAIACGYYDQPHFNRDFQCLGGMSPAQYRRTA